MFRMISIISFVATIVVIGMCCVVFPCCKECSWRPIEVLRRIIRVFTFLLLEQKLSLVGVLRKLVYLLAAICFVVLLFTGFYPRLVLGECISGYWLMLHATFAPVFAVCLAVLGVLWASKCRFDSNDWPWLQRIIERVTLVKRCREEGSCERSGAGQKPLGSALFAKIAFWMIMVLALPLIVSVVSSMFPLLGTHWQEVVLDIHRYTALAFAVAVIVHTYLMVRIKMNE